MGLECNQATTDFGRVQRQQLELMAVEGAGAGTGTGIGAHPQGNATYLTLPWCVRYGELEKAVDALSPLPLSSIYCTLGGHLPAVPLK